MSNISFVSHMPLKKDQYTKEAVYLLVNGFRLLYVRKQSKTGGLFWSVPSVSVTKDDGEKEYLESFLQDSTFLEKDIKNFLDKRLWEKKGAVHTSNEEEIPF
jgi:hypothetical protein